MSDATVAAVASVAVALITAILGPAVLARYKSRRTAALAAVRVGRPLVPARPGARHAPPVASAKPASRFRTIAVAQRGDGGAALRVLLRESSPRAVLARLADIPPLSRRAIAHELYVGRWAEWGGVVRDVRESDAGGYYVHVVDPDDGAAALLDFTAAERPALEALREGDRVRYLGRVTGAEDGFVTLDSATISPVA